MTDGTPELMRLKEAAKILRLHSRYVLSLINSKELPAMKIGGSVGWLIRKSDIETFVERRIKKIEANER